MTARRIAYTIFALSLFLGPAAGQGTVAQAEHAYRAGDYALALDHLSNLKGLLAVAPRFDGVRGEERERILFDLARCRFALADTAGARDVLRELFRHDSRQSTGRLDVPPDDARSAVLDALQQMRSHTRQREIDRTSPLKAGLRSLVFPGWGQRYRGRTRRGNILSAAAGGLALGWFLADQAYRSALDSYRSTTDQDLNLPARTGGPDDPNPFAERFDRVESRASTARTLGFALAAVWFYSVTENFVIEPGRVTLTLRLD